MELVSLSSSNFSSVVQSASEDMPDLETILFQDKKCAEDTVMYRVGYITQERRMVGFGMAVSGTWDPILPPGCFDILVIVEEKWRERGVGTNIYKELEQFAVNHRANAIRGIIRDSDPKHLKWVEKRGFHIEKHKFESILDLSKFNFKKFNDKLKLGSGLQFTSFADYPQDEKRIEQLFELWWKIARDTPGMRGKPRPKLEQIRELFDDMDPHGIIFIKDSKKWVAMSLIIPESNNVFYNNLTGVIRSYRGRGLSLAIKIKGVQFAINRNAQYLLTSNDSNNERILAVNQKMGYESRSGVYFLMKYL